MGRRRVATAVLVEAYRRGDSCATIAAAWHMPKSTVVSRLRRAGEPLRPPGRPRRAVAELLKELTSMKQEATR